MNYGISRVDLREGDLVAKRYAIDPTIGQVSFSSSDSIPALQEWYNWGFFLFRSPCKHAASPLFGFAQREPRATIWGKTHQNMCFITTNTYVSTPTIGLILFAIAAYLLRMSSLSSRLNVSSFTLPPATKALLVTTTASSVLLQFLKRQHYNQLIQAGEKDLDIAQIVVPYLQLIPNHTLLHPWTVVTGIFVDATIFRFLVSLVLMYFAGKFIERSWSSKELIKFVVIVGAVSNLLTSVSLIFLNLIFGNNFFNIPVDGNLCLLVSYLVVLKQLTPEHSIVLFKGVAQARAKHIPFAVLVILTLVSITTLSPTPAVQAWLGLIVSWAYLRFFQTSVADPLLPQPGDVVGVRKLTGDASETFSFVHFFPEILTPIIAPLFDQIYELLVQLHILTRFNDSDIEQGNIIASRRVAGQPATVDTRNAAERRRQVALKVLEERIGEDSSQNQPQQQGAVDHV